MIFDMDGVLIDSEHLWRKAMMMTFAENNMNLTENDCRKTMGMRIGEVIGLWLAHHQKPASLAPALEERIVTLLLELINSDGKVIAGIPELIDYCIAQKLKTGLATSSSQRLVNAVLTRTALKSKIEATVTADHLRYAKPHPEVFLECAGKLGVAPGQCIVIEDSLNGVIAAKAARMKVIAVPDDDHLKADDHRARQFILADYQAENMRQVLAFFKKIYGE